MADILEAITLWGAQYSLTMFSMLQTCSRVVSARSSNAAKGLTIQKDNLVQSPKIFFGFVFLVVASKSVNPK